MRFSITTGLSGGVIFSGETVLTAVISENDFSVCLISAWFKQTSFLFGFESKIIMGSTFYSLPIGPGGHVSCHPLWYSLKRGVPHIGQALGYNRLFNRGGPETGRPCFTIKKPPMFYIDGSLPCFSLKLHILIPNKLYAFANTTMV